MESTEDIRQKITRRQEQIASREFDSYFKYFSDKDEVMEGIFKEQKIRFTQPRAFNDPLEFSPTMRFHDNSSSYRFYDLDGTMFPSVEFFFRVQIIESQINAYGILSLTKIPDSFDMWSQYANGHRGFVIEFKEDFYRHPLMKSKTGDEYPVKKVEYVDDYSIYLEDLVDKNHEIRIEVIHNELFFKKTSRWEHECEYRMVRPLEDHPDYQPPKTNYTYIDTKKYLFPFEWDCVLSIILGANMSTKNKRQIVQCCKEHNIHLSQAHIVRDIKDRFGKPSAILTFGIDEYTNEDKILLAKPQLFCTDTVRLGHTYSTVKITKIADLPYYKDHEEVVNQLYRNLKANSDF
ncbi:hypothetical protein ES708_20112 [subsurface metagenome]